MRLSVRISIVLIFFFIFFTLIKPTFAQSANPYSNPNIDSNVPKNLHTWTQSVMIEVASALSCQLTGIDPVNPKQQCLGVNINGKIGFINTNQGAIGAMSSMIGILYYPPVNIADYTKYLSRNFGIAKQAYADTTCIPATSGIGYCGLMPIMNIWISFRNIVYAFFVLVFIITGVAIMLRVKIDPRTVMTIQNQIPRIIIALFLVTFSFAIAGLLIDFMWVIMYLIIIFFSNHFNNFGDISTIDLNKSVFQYLDGVFNGGVFGVAAGSAGAADNLIHQMISHIFGGFIDWFLRIASIGALDLILLAIPFIIVSIAILWALFRLWFSLITAYVTILIYVVFGPFMIIGGVIPGKPYGFSTWFRGMLANLLTFPTVAGMFLIGKFFMEAFSSITPADNKFLVPFIGIPENNGSLSSLIGLGIILLTPSILGKLKRALKAPAFDIKPIAAALGVGSGFLSGTVRNTAQQYQSSREIVLKKATVPTDTGVQKLEYGRRGIRSTLFGRFSGRK